MLPMLLYRAVCGYPHSGRGRTTFRLVTRLASTRTGAAPASTQFSTGVVISNWLVPTPPPQWNIPGTMKRRKNSSVDGPVLSPTACNARHPSSR
jgi:hypothetical protein